jgi:transposase
MSKKKPTSKKKNLPDISSKSYPTELKDDLIRSVGRPSKYQPEMCMDLIYKMAQGKSFNTACVEMGINPDTGYEYVKEKGDYYKSEFAEAKKWGQALSERWWDEVGRLNLNNKDFNNVLYMMIRQNMHGWTRKVEGKIETKNTNETIETKKIEIKFDEGYVANVIKILSSSNALEEFGESSPDE